MSSEEKRDTQRDETLQHDDGPDFEDGRGHADAGERAPVLLHNRAKKLHQLHPNTFVAPLLVDDVFLI